MKTYTAPIFVPIKLAGPSSGGNCRLNILTTDEGCRVWNEGYQEYFFTDQNQTCDEPSYCYEVPMDDLTIYNS